MGQSESKIGRGFGIVRDCHFCVVFGTTSSMSEEAVRRLEGRLKAVEERVKKVEVRDVDGAASTVIVER